MTALPVQSAPGSAPPALPVIDRADWVDCNEAACILGGHPDRWRRDAREKLAPFGRAVYGLPPAPEKGNARWWVHRNVNLALARGELGKAHRLPDLSPYSEKQLQQAWAKVACVQAFRHARDVTFRGQPEKEWVGGLVDSLRAQHPKIKISERSLRRWHSDFRGAADLVKLINKAGGNTRGEPDPAAWQHFCGLYLNENKRHLKFCWEQTAADAREQGWRWCAYTQLVRLARKKLPPAVRARARKPADYRNKFSTYIKMDPDAWAPGELWIGDHSVLDLWCDADGELVRPWITAWMDWRTRKIVGFVISTAPNSETIRAALAAAIQDPTNKGGPDLVYIDNGRDYAAYTFIGATKQQRRKLRVEQAGERTVLRRGYLDLDQEQGLYGLLKIGVTFSLPYNARAKGRLETWFGHWLHERHDKIYDSYAGNAPGNRPERLAAVLRDPLKVPTLAHVREQVAAFIAAYNERDEHSKADLDGLSPAEAYEQARGRTFADPDVLRFFALTYHKPVRVGRNGVTIKPLGKSISYHSQALVALKGTGREVYVGYHQHDLSKVYVLDEDRRLICVAESCHRGLAASKAGREHLAAAMKRQRAAERAAKVLAKDPGARVLPTESLATREAVRERKRQRQRPPEAPGPKPGPGMAPGLKLVHTPLDGQSKRLQALDAPQPRKAAGAEGMTPPEGAAAVGGGSSLLAKARARQAVGARGFVSGGAGTSGGGGVLGKLMRKGGSRG